jgi:membrane protein
VTRLLSFPRRAYTRLRDIQLARTAGSLSFTTLLAVVPLASVTLAFVARFPIFQQALGAFEGFLLKHLLPDSAGRMVHEYVMGFAEHAARLTGISVVLVCVTAALAIYTVEREINAIWGIRARRSVSRRLIVYALGLTAGPVVIGASMSITTWAIAQSLAAVPLRKTFGNFIVAALPFVFSTAGLTLLYKYVPARPVRLGPALVGGIGAALALEAAKELFALYVIRVPTYQLIYGALSALPVFLVWIYLGWIIVLAGAAVTATLAEGARRSRG